MQETVIEFQDFVIGDGEWRSFRSEASEEELFVLAIGSKFMTRGKKFFIRALISVLGTILTVLAVVFGGDTFASFLGIALLVCGYFFFNGMAVKLTCYTSTYTDCYKRLSPANKEYLDSLLGKEKFFAELLRSLLEFGLMIFTIPYRALLMLISMVLPQAENWCIAHGGFGGTVVTNIQRIRYRYA